MGKGEGAVRSARGWTAWPAGATQQRQSVMEIERESWGRERSKMECGPASETGE